MVSKRVSYGGIVFDGHGRVLLREPRGHYDGYVWTFPKGLPEAGEIPGEAAVRETREETGVHAEIPERIPGTFMGGTGETTYFLMRPTGRRSPPDRETWSIRWCSPDEAGALIRESTNSVGVKRALEVLQAGLAQYRMTGLT